MISIGAKPTPLPGNQCEFCGAELLAHEAYRRKCDRCAYSQWTCPDCEKVFPGTSKNPSGQCEECFDWQHRIKVFTTKDSGQRVEFETGAVRDVQDDKPRYDLIPAAALKRVADLYARGAKKYSEWNWAKGIPSSRCYASALRHLYQFGEGATDEDHLAAVVFNVLAIIHFQEKGRIDVLDFPEKNSQKVLTNQNFRAKIIHGQTKT